MICSQCKKCGECGKPYSANSNYAERCNDFEKKKITNFERIKNMSVEEMVKTIDDYRYFLACDLCVFFGDNCPNNSCTVGIKLWLESEAEE